jgi:hypothetical protein
MGFAAQPMMSLPVLDNLMQHGLPRDMSGKGFTENCTALLTQFCELTAEHGSSSPGFLLRFGYARSPSVRTGRIGDDRTVLQ